MKGGEIGITDILKKCTKCKQIKLKSDFYKSKKYRSGTLCECKECTKKTYHDWAKRNKERLRVKTAKWRKNNRERAKQICIKADRKRRSDPKGKLNFTMSSNIRKALNGQKGRKSWQKLVGYSLSNLKHHLEKQFEEGMSWDNYGEWHIDHIIPISAFNFYKPEDLDFKKCWALINLQPLWAKDNMTKQAKLNMPFQPSFAF